MKIPKRIALFLLGALSLSTTALGAAIPEPYTVMPLSSGIYAEINTGYAGLDTSDVAPKDDGVTVGFVLGYKFNTYLAIDTGYTIMPHVFVHTWTTHLALKGIWPLGDGSWDAFGKIGGALANGVRNPAMNPQTNIVLYYGGGFTRWFQQNFGAILQATGTTSNANTPMMYTVTLGLTYFF